MVVREAGEEAGVAPSWPAFACGGATSRDHWGHRVSGADLNAQVRPLPTLRGASWNALCLESPGLLNVDLEIPAVLSRKGFLSVT